MAQMNRKMLVALLLLTLALPAGLTVWAQDSDGSKPPAKAAAPTGLDSIQVGSLEITPSKANLVLKSEHNRLYFNPTIRFKITNTSASDLKIIIFAHSIGATDNLGERLFHEQANFIKSSGIMLSYKYPNEFNKAFQDEKGTFITLAPKQVFEAQLQPSSNSAFLEDKNHELAQNHNPKTITFSATLGIINIDNTTELRAFSFSDLPVTVSKH
jgi:hypothetical protein